MNDQTELQHIQRIRQRPPDFVTAPPPPETPPDHEYLSTGCWHGEHDYCKSMTGHDDEKLAGKCVFCDARCRCECHSEFDTTEAEFDQMLTEAQPAVLVPSSPGPGVG